MGLKPFQLLADLIKLQVFVAPHQAIEPDVAAQVCETHGFVFEREKRERNLTLAQAAGLFFVTDVLLLPWGLPPAALLLGLVLGLAIGGTWVALRAGTLLSVLTAMPVFFLAHILLNGAGGFLPTCGGSLIVGFASGYLGARREVSIYE